jgi:hypothetical protein
MSKADGPIAFVWDRGNSDKNWHKHGVTNRECEEVFFDPNKQEYPDPNHSTGEPRKIMLGETKKGRVLFLVYTVRNSYVRVISARDLNKRKEASLYEKGA